ncbi:MAG: magnesium/cobalt transporter CorA [Saprospiraceae bacterium]
MVKPVNIKSKNKIYPSGKKGLPPGSFIYTGKSFGTELSIEVIQYTVDTYESKRLTLDQLLALNTSSGYFWINILGLHDEKFVMSICQKFGIHSLFIEDILNIQQRPKLEVEKSYIYIPFKCFEWNDIDGELEYEQFSLILFNNVLLTFQEKLGDQFDEIRARMARSDSMVRSKEIDYLFYRLIDVTVDNYFGAIEKIGDNLENLENKIIQRPQPEDVGLIQNFNKEIMLLRRNVLPLREVLFRLSNTEHPVLSNSIKKYIVDVMDHSIQVTDTIEMYREISVGLKDLHLNTVSYEMNRVVKTLTVISTYFIPLTFIVGVYGMNFKYMPELTYKYAYPIIWLVMISVVIGLTIYFKRKNWF